MQLRCTYCQTMYAISREDMLAALEHMDEEKLKYYDAHCPKCRRANRVERIKLELAYPAWKADLKAMAKAVAPGTGSAAEAKPASPAVKAPVPAPKAKAPAAKTATPAAKAKAPASKAKAPAVKAKAPAPKAKASVVKTTTPAAKGTPPAKAKPAAAKKK